ncbi:MAG TPA: hypothetical protein VMV15_06165 [Candidatus Binataceae bacterium]|nr:hypothetical protein [Candidatus Binataceae bacterium]
MLKGTVTLAVVVLSASMAFAQVPGNPYGIPSATARNAVASHGNHSKPLSGFTAVGTGNSNFVMALTPCQGLTCPGTDTCTCLTISGVNLKATGLGHSTLDASINVDTSTLTPNGAGDGFCDLASGPATVTAANGSTAALDLTGSFCVGNSFVNYVLNGGFTVVGGTGHLANAGGTGNYAISAPEAFGDSPAAVVMNGAMSK